MKTGKRYKGILEKIDKDREYDFNEAFEKLKEIANAKFDESVELALHMGLDTTKADQKIRGTVSLPHGTGKEVRVLVFAKGDKETEAKEAGADFVGSEDLAEKIQKEGWTEFDVAIATPDMMKVVGKLGKILGPRGIMPNPKTGTVTFDIADAVKQFKAGKIEIRIDKLSNVQILIGKVSFTVDKLRENLNTVLETVIKMKPATAKGTYIKSATVSSTMGPGLRLKLSEVRKIA